MRYLSQTEDFWAIDLEADSLEPTQIWVVCLENIVTGEQVSFLNKEDFKKWVDSHPNAVYIAHNGIYYDFPALRDLWGINIPIDACIDTMLLSFLYNPYIKGGHALEDWGIRLKFPKGEFNDFSKYTKEMHTYCQRDATLCGKIFKALRPRFVSLKVSEKSIWLEHHFAEIIERQQRTGFKFDIEGARKLYEQLRQEEERLLGLIRSHFPPRLKKVGTYEYKTKKDGGPYSSYIRHTKRYPKITHHDDGTYTCFEYEIFNVGSPAQRLERLLGAGFKPVKKTKSGGWATGEDVVLDFFEESGIPEIGMMAEWLVLNGRANMINNWLENVNETDSRIHGVIFSCGAGSRRCRHSEPNTANVPSTEAKYGTECRSLWISSGDNRLLGIDAAGLEGRILVHYLASVRPDLAQAAYDYIIDTQKVFGVKDFHTLNAQQITKLVLPKERKPVKNDFYALIYGATDKKLGAMSGGDEELGKKIRKVLGDAVPGLGDLMEDARREFERSGGIIRTIDGGFVRCESPHAALNYRCQSAGAIVMKLAAVIFEKEIIKNGYNVRKVGDIHDEWQYECPPDCAELVGKRGVESIRLAGQKLALRVPLDGTFSIGRTWAETH